MDNTALTITTPGMPALSVEQAISRYEQLNSFVSQVLKEGTDYGVIPGTGGRKTLLKPGAEKLALFFGLHPTFEDMKTIEDWSGQDHGGEPFFYYRQKCRLYHNGEVVAEADGSCNSREIKYRYRQGERKCPKCEESAIIKGKEEYGGGWLCFAKKGGCGAKYKDGDKTIEDQQVGRILNPDIADVVNTILKQSQKRAFVGVTLIGANASDYFTQDLEDLPGYGEIIESTARVVEPPAPQPKAQATEPPQATPPQDNGKPDAQKSAIKTVKFGPRAKQLIDKLDSAGVPHKYNKGGGLDYDSLQYTIGTHLIAGANITEDNLDSVLNALEAHIIREAQKNQPAEEVPA